MREIIILYQYCLNMISDLVNNFTVGLGSIGEYSSSVSSSWKKLSSDEKNEFKKKAKQRKEGELSLITDKDKWQELRKSMNRISQEVSVLYNV